jgi:adenylate cyclase
MFHRLIRFSGIFLIVGFCAWSIFASFQSRDFKDTNLSLFFSYPSFFEDRFYDYRMLQTYKPEKIEKRIVLAKIDDESLMEIGRWPWPRQVWAEFVDKMGSFGAKILAFDVFFSEPELACNSNSPDQALSDSFQRFTELKEGNLVILPYKLDTGYEDHFKELPDVLLFSVLNAEIKGGANLSPLKVSKVAYPLEKLLEAEVELGHIGATEDPDGIFRQYPVVGFAGEYLPSFAMSAYKAYTDDQPSVKRENTNEYPILQVKTGQLRLNDKGETKIRWLGASGNFPAVSIKDILKASKDDPEMHEVFEERIVYIGSTAFGAHDLRHTPVDQQMPGVYFHMNMNHMLLEGKFFVDQKESNQYSWIILIGGTLLMLFVQLFGQAIIDVVALVGICIGAYFLDTYYLLPLGYEIKLFFGLLSVIACYSWNTFFNFYLASKDKNFLKDAFSTYISPELIDDMYKTGQLPSLGGQEGILTAYFTDIQGFSSFSEKLSATQLVELLNEYLTVMTDLLLGDLGTLDKYEGDAIIAFFGAPMTLEDHAIRACRVAVHMQSSLLVLREKWVSEGDKWPEIVHAMRMRIGINSGPMVTGNMGSRSRMNYTMMGDSVNLAARLEEAAKQYGIFTQVSQSTILLTGDEFVARELDTIRVMGKSEPVTTFDLFGIKGETEDNLLQLKEYFEAGLAHYKAQEWDQAVDKFNQSLVFENLRYPDLEGKKTNPSLIYVDRCNEFKENPPAEDWDGVYTLTSK